MFNKESEFVHTSTKDFEYKTFSKEYSYPDNFGANDIVSMIADSNYTIERVKVEVDDVDSYGSGDYTLQEFLEIYNSIHPSISIVYVYAKELDCDITIYDKENRVYLIFRNVKEIPATEITDIIQEKKMDL